MADDPFAGRTTPALLLFGPDSPKSAPFTDRELRLTEQFCHLGCCVPLFDSFLLCEAINGSLKSAQSLFNHTQMFDYPVHVALRAESLPHPWGDVAFLADWPHWAEYYSREMQRRFYPRGEVRQVGRLWAFRSERAMENWAIVVHPLWETGVMVGLLAEAWTELNRPGANVQFIDTFTLGRQQVAAREKLEERWRL